MKNAKRLIAVILSFAMVFSLMGTVAYAESTKAESDISFAVLSDPHYYPDSLTGDNCEAYRNFCSYNLKLYAQSGDMVRTAIESMLARNPGLKYILVPGDLTKDGELEGHRALAEIFREYEEKYGVEFLVTVGNHDINQKLSSTFENGREETAPTATADDFREIYADFGYDLAFTEYAEKGENVRGQLSYAADLMDSEGNCTYRLISVDTCMYSFDEPSKETRGEITEDTMNWIKELTDEAYAEGKTPFVMMHHSIAPHMDAELSVFQIFLLNDYLDVAESFASWGINYVFTGHLHSNDISSVVNDDGQVIYDVETSSVSDYPCTYREAKLTTYADGRTELKADTVDFDEGVPFTWDGKTYERGTYKYVAFSEYACDSEANGGELSGTGYVMRFLRGGLGEGILKDIRETGSLEAYLKGLGVDIEKILFDFLSPYIGDGIKIGNLKIFSTDNLMWFINDLLDQIYDLYIKDETALLDLCREIIDEFMAIEVSEYPCEKFIDTFGFGDRSKPGTLGDLVISAVCYLYSGDEDTSDDKFVTDAIKNFDSGNLINTVFDKLVDLLLHTLIEDNILGKIEIRTYKLLSDEEIMDVMGKGINYLLKSILKNDLSYMNLIDCIFDLGILPYESIYDILDKELLQKYLTQSQLESVGIYIAGLLTDLTVDEDPAVKNDSHALLTNEEREVSVTRENYRLPTAVTVTMGEDSSKEAFISWYSKSTLSGDIEIYRVDSEPYFRGENTVTDEFTVETQTERVLRSYPGIDIGIIGFFPAEFEINRHVATLKNLEPGATYYFRVGDAERDWWSQTGTVTTADGGKDVTFLHLADPQSQNERQYERAWQKVLSAATELYDEDFIINTGDIVDHGDNSKQWSWALDTGADYLMNTFMMPATGNHEGKGTNATVNYFTLPNLPEQDTAKGVYYSFDYNNVHFAVLNTEDLDEDEGITDRQLDWLKKDMQESDAQWKLLMLHKAPYSQGSHYKDDDVCEIRNQLKNLMPELGIDMVFQGHDHVYMRTGSLVNNRHTAYDKTYLNYKGDIYRTQVLPEGTTYVISGTSGVKTYIQNDESKTDRYFPRAEKILSVDAPMFSAVEIVDGILYFNAYSVTEDGAENVDRFAIQKDITQGTVEEGYTEDEDEASVSPLIKLLTAVRAIMEKVVAFIKAFLPFAE
ncbi:MAG: metallophosphoesterase [Clostridia bacterium]|nr:metallophosphoesterase [Clostridia bacterium]